MKSNFYYLRNDFVSDAFRIHITKNKFISYIYIIWQKHWSERLNLKAKTHLQAVFLKQKTKNKKRNSINVVITPPASSQISDNNGLFWRHLTSCDITWHSVIIEVCLIHGVQHTVFRRFHLNEKYSVIALISVNIVPSWDIEGPEIARDNIHRYQCAIKHLLYSYKYFVSFEVDCDLKKWVFVMF